MFIVNEFPMPVYSSSILNDFIQLVNQLINYFIL